MVIKYKINLKHAAKIFTVNGLVIRPKYVICDVHPTLSTSFNFCVHSHILSQVLVFIIFSDAVSTLVFSGNTTFPVGTLLEANISWNGRLVLTLADFWCVLPHVHACCHVIDGGITPVIAVVFFSLIYHLCCTPLHT